MSNDQLWKRANPLGAPRKFETPEALWDQCLGYFQWVEDNPLWEEKLFHSQGHVTRDRVYKMRAMTIGGLCLYLGISLQTWHNWKSGREDLFDVIHDAEAAIREQKFAGAAADLLNANIIARDLGLADRQDHTTAGESLNKGRSLADFYADVQSKSEPG